MPCFSHVLDIGLQSFFIGDAVSTPDVLYLHGLCHRYVCSTEDRTVIKNRCEWG